jgi:hypothetical protein
MNCDHSLSESSDDVTAQLAQLELAAAATTDAETDNSVATNAENANFSLESDGDDEQRDIDVDELQVCFGQVSMRARSDAAANNRIFLSYIA